MGKATRAEHTRGKRKEKNEKKKGGTDTKEGVKMHNSSQRKLTERREEPDKGDRKKEKERKTRKKPKKGRNY